MHIQKIDNTGFYGSPKLFGVSEKSLPKELIEKLTRLSDDSGASISLEKVYGKSSPKLYYMLYADKLVGDINHMGHKLVPSKNISEGNFIETIYNAAMDAIMDLKKNIKAASKR